MGKVFKAYDRKVDEVVALKLIRPEISVNDKAIERFKNELKIARKITPPERLPDARPRRGGLLPLHHDGVCRRART